MSLKFKIITAVVVMILMFSPLAQQRQAQAQFGLSLGGLVFETNPVLITNASTETFFRTVTKIATEALKRRLLTMVVDQIIAWIDGGGKPLFITDWKAFLSDAANIAIGDVALQLGAGFLCSPFGLQVQISVLRPPIFTDQILCTLDSIVGNIENFYDDFRNGGWLAYAESWQPQNNYYGAVLLAMQELNKRTAEETEASALEALAGDGFLGTRRCDSTGRYCFITTPGAQIGALAAKAIGSDIDYLINSNDLAVYIGAISDALINRLIRSGVRGLISLTTPDSPEGGFVSGGGSCGGLAGAALTNCLSLVRVGENDFTAKQKKYLLQIDATLLPRQLGDDGLVKSVNNQVILRNRLTELRDCQVNRNLPEAISTIANLETEQALLNQFEEELIANRRIVDPLTDAKTQIQNPSFRDTITISFHFNNVINFLDKDIAIAFQTAKDAQKQEVQTKVDGNLPIIQQQLNACRGF